ncbi:hypothetical protein COO60DRAFT_1643847 [Scenedesmus sp. NREL 46B-D3]|nr:hypothetical protein COO60DRAFT_1643847 [Scenedesmus sp. NREL 46B-D3]
MDMTDEKYVVSCHGELKEGCWFSLPQGVTLTFTEAAGFKQYAYFNDVALVTERRRAFADRRADKFITYDQPGQAVPELLLSFQGLDVVAGVFMQEELDKATAQRQLRHISHAYDAQRMARTPEQAAKVKRDIEELVQDFVAHHGIVGHPLVNQYRYPLLAHALTVAARVRHGYRQQSAYGMFVWLYNHVQRVSLSALLRMFGPGQYVVATCRSSLGTTNPSWDVIAALLQDTAGSDRRVAARMPLYSIPSEPLLEPYDRTQFPAAISSRDVLGAHWHAHSEIRETFRRRSHYRDLAISDANLFTSL